MESPSNGIITFKASFLFLLLIAVIFITGAANKPNEQQIKSMTTKTITQVLKEHTQELMSISGVVGIAQGICNGEPCIKVYISEKTPEVSEKVPAFLEGYPVMIEKTGKIKALPKNRK